MCYTVTMLLQEQSTTMFIEDLSPKAVKKGMHEVLDTSEWSLIPTRHTYLRAYMLLFCMI